MEEIPYKNTDIIDLRELLLVIKKRKKLIVLITLLFVLLAGIYVSIAKPVYQVKAMVQIGKLEAGTSKETPIDNIEDIQQKLEYIYGVSSKKKRAYPKVKAISIGKKSKSVFSVLVEGHSNGDAISFIKTIVSKIETNYKTKVSTFINTQKELISLTNDDIQTAKDNLKKLQNTLENYNQKILNLSQKDAALAGIYTIQISQNQAQAQGLQSHISALKAKLYNLKLTITPLRISKTKIVGNIEFLDKPIKPKKALIMIVAFITGLMFSIFLVFFLAFVQGLKEEK